MKDLMSKLVKFYIVGGCGTVINLGITYLLTQYLSLWYVLSNVIGIFIATTIIFFANRSWTFNTIEKHRRIFTQYMYYWGSNLIAISIQISLGFILTEFFHVWYIFSIFTAIVIASVVNFLINKTWTFQEQKIPI